MSISDHRVNILIVDDVPENLLAIEAILDDPRYRLVRADSGKEALRRLMEDDFAVILLDVQMPGMDGYETAKIIKQRDASLHIPIIFITAVNRDEQNIYDGYAVGAVDFLTKPFNPMILKSKVSVFADLFIKELELRRLNRQLEERNQRIGLLSEMIGMLQTCISQEEAWKVIGMFMTEIFPGKAGALYIMDEASRMFDLASQWGETISLESGFPQDACWALRRGKVYPQQEDPVAVACRHVGDPPPPDYLCAPLLMQGEVRGLLHFQEPPGEPQTEGVPFQTARVFITAAAGQIALALTNISLRK